MGTEHGPEQIVGVRNVRHPVAHRFVDRILERPAAGVDLRDARPEQPHAVHVQRLPPHVVGAHVHFAVEPEQRAGGGRRHAVLAGAGLRHHPPLPHPDREQRLAQRVVDLVGPGMRQILPLEEDPRHPSRPRPGLEGRAQPRRLVDGSGSGRRNAAAAPPAPRRTRDPRGPRGTPAPALPPAQRGSPARTAPRTLRSTRGRPDRADRSSEPSCARHLLEEIAKPAGSLPAGSLLDPAGDVDAVGAGRCAAPRPRSRDTGHRRERIRRRAATPAATPQSTVRPVPPRRTGSRASSSTVTRGGTRAAASRVSSPATGTAFRMRYGNPSHSVGGSSPWSCTAARPACAAIRRTSARVGSTKTPTGATSGGSSRAIAAARSGSMYRGLRGQNTKPTADAPRSAARKASSRRVMPHTFTLAPLIVPALGPPVLREASARPRPAFARAPRRGPARS